MVQKSRIKKQYRLYLFFSNLKKQSIMSDPISLHGKKQTIDQILHCTSGAAVPFSISLQGLQGTMQVNSSRAPRNPLSLEKIDGGVEETPFQNPHDDFFQDLIDQEEELEIEILGSIDFDLDAIQPELRPFALLSFENTDDEYNYAIPIEEEDGLLYWEFPNQKEGNQLHFELGIQHFGNPTVGVPEGIRTRRKRFRPFRWLKKKVGKIFIKKAIFKRLLFKSGAPNDEIWGKMKKKEDWSFLKPATQPGKKALLLIHGFLGGPKNYYDFVQGEMSELEKLYEDRVFLFQHPSLWHDVGENAQSFFDLWKGETNLHLDVVTRSRGALVFRQIAEINPDQQWTDLNVKLGNIVMLAGPNEGTPLAKPGNLDVYINILTNLASLTKVGKAIQGLSWLIRLIKGRQVIDWQHSLRGLYSMSPESEFVTKVNDLSLKRRNYHSLSVNSDPDGGLFKLILEKLVDPIFNGEENDLINPTHGAYGADGNDEFKIEIFNTNFDGKNIYHLNYFKYATIRNQIVAWLQDPIV